MSRLLARPPVADMEGPRLQRAHGAGRLDLEAAHGAGPASLSGLFQSGAAKIRFASNDHGVREAVLINTAGGLTGGDRMDWSIRLGAGARGRATTQACEKVYRSPGPAAEVGVSLCLSAGAALEWLPQETILFDGSHLQRRFDISLASSSRLLAVEAVVLGRRAMGENQPSIRLRDRWRVRMDGELIFADELRLEPDQSATQGEAMLAGACAFASVLLADREAEAALPAVLPILGPGDGASAFGGKLVCRLLDQDPFELRRRLTGVVAALGEGRGTPRLWTV